MINVRHLLASLAALTCLVGTLPASELDWPIVYVSRDLSQVELNRGVEPRGVDGVHLCRTTWTGRR